MADYWLTPPSRAVFFISVLLAVLALLVRYAHIAIPVVSNHSFETLLVAFLLLLAGNLADTGGPNGAWIQFGELKRLSPNITWPAWPRAELFCAPIRFSEFPRALG